MVTLEKKVKGSPKPMGAINCTKFHSNPSSNCLDISAWTIVVDRLNNVAISRAMLVVWLKAEAVLQA